MAASDVEITAARKTAAAAVVAVATPLVAEYNSQLAAVELGQKALSGKLQGVLEELTRVQANAPSASDPNAVLVGPYVRKVEDLRKRLDKVSYTMNRVQVRLESLQTAVTKGEAGARAARPSGGAK